MAPPLYTVNPLGVCKRFHVAMTAGIPNRCANGLQRTHFTNSSIQAEVGAPSARSILSLPEERGPDRISKIFVDEAKGSELSLRLPRSVQAIYLKPLKRRAEYGVPTCDLQLRSYNVRNVEFFADFALRAAYYLRLPAAGPIPLPRITERWTVPRSHFIHKKSQENFERITLRRLIQIQDGNPETVEVWLAFLRKHTYYGVGMKANVWEHERLGFGKTTGARLEKVKDILEPKWARFGRRNNLETSERVHEMMNSRNYRHISDAPLGRVDQRI